MNKPLSITRQQVTLARWVADHSSDETVTEVPVQVAGADQETVLLRFERSPIDGRWVLVTPVVVIDATDKSHGSGNSAGN